IRPEYLKGASIPIGGLTSGFPYQGSLVEGSHGGSVSPHNVHETGVSPGRTVRSPHRGRRGGAGRANSKKDLVMGPIRGFCALQAFSSWSCDTLPRPVSPRTRRTKTKKMKDPKVRGC